MSQVELPSPPSDPISAVRFAPHSSSRLLVASWDKNIHVYDRHSSGQWSLTRSVPHRAPVLDACFGDDDNTVFSAGVDWCVNKIDLDSGDKTLLSSHNDAAASCVRYSSQHSLLVSGSWDSTLHVHILADGKLQHAPATIQLPSKVYDMSLTQTKLVVAMASRQIFIYDLAALKLLTSQAAPSEESHGENVLQIEPWQQRESSLKFMTRAVCCMPNDAGYAASSIEGRVGVEWFDPSHESQSRKYAFKCHRQTEQGPEGEIDVIYPVHTLAFHPIETGTFASGGGDGFVILWDGVSKRRIRQYQAYPGSIPSLAWSADGKYLAVAVSPGVEDGKDIHEGPNHIFVKELAEGEAKGKVAK
ncbi:hypothetical protein MBLNU459_g1868t1 [Dothideomycetes sp. NU459]